MHNNSELEHLNYMQQCSFKNETQYEEDGCLPSERALLTPRHPPKEQP